jgi:hypothetical protein
VVESGELLPIPCGRNGCPYCRRRNVQVTAAKMAINQTLTDRPVTHAILSTTRDWASPETLREGWHQFARRVKLEVKPDATYAWYREFTQRDATHDWKRTHYHSTWALDDDDQAQAVAQISNEVWGRLTAATSEHAHGWQRVYDAGGLARYIAGLVGHHLKHSQLPHEEWRGRRYGTARGFYAIAVDELDRRAKAAVRDERFVHHLELELASTVPDGLPYFIFDELLTARLELAKDRPSPRIVRLDRGWLW